MSTSQRPDPVDIVVADIANVLRDNSGLLGLDVDGVLAPITAHADHAHIDAHTLATVHLLAAHRHVAIVSGRTVDDLVRFDFDPSLSVIGSHGGQRRGTADIPLDPDERSRCDAVVGLCRAAADACGDGAWVEIKPYGAVLHWREVDPGHGDTTIRRLHDELSSRAGVWVTIGHRVVEATVRHASKATAMRTLATEFGTTRMAYIGDDRTDEDVFAVLTADDVGVHVGDADTLARRRLSSPIEVAACLDGLAAALGLTAE